MENETPLTEGAIEWISANGFKSFSHLPRLELKQANVLIGANGAGKSNFIELFRYLSAICDGRLWLFVGMASGADRLLHFGRQTTESMDIELSLLHPHSHYTIGLSATEGDALLPTHETFRLWDDDKANPDRLLSSSKSSAVEARISELSNDEAVRSFQKRLRGWRVHHFHDTSIGSPMKKQSSIYEIHGLEADGRNLASYLLWLRDNRSWHYEQIRKTIRLVARFFDDFAFRSFESQPPSVRLEWRHDSSSETFDVSQMSDGTLRFIALTTLLLQPDEFMPSTIMVDEPELGLHPYAIEIVGSMMRAVSRTTQLIVATQSSHLLDQFEAGDVLVANRTNGESQLGRIPITDQLQDQLQHFSLGQLWERNHFEGCP